jgi:hypothetical protein
VYSGSVGTGAWGAFMVSDLDDTGQSGRVHQMTAQVTDTAGNVGTSAVLNVYIDTTAPGFGGTAPASSSYVNHTRLSYTLNEAFGSGTITWSHTGGSPDGDHAQSLTGTELDLGAHNDITLTDNPTLVSNAVYSIAFEGEDLAGNPAGTVTTTGVTYDVTAPTVNTFTPANGSIFVTLNASYNLQIDFSENIYAGTGNITLKYVGGANIETFNVDSSSRVTGWGTATLAIDPTNALPANSNIAVQIDSAAILDIAGNNYAGISNDTTWTFGTSYKEEFDYGGTPPAPNPHPTTSDLTAASANWQVQTAGTDTVQYVSGSLTYAGYTGGNGNSASGNSNDNVAQAQIVYNSLAQTTSSSQKVFLAFLIRVPTSAAWQVWGFGVWLYDGSTRIGGITCRGRNTTNYRLWIENGAGTRTQIGSSTFNTTVLVVLRYDASAGGLTAYAYDAETLNFTGADFASTGTPDNVSVAKAAGSIINRVVINQYQGASNTNAFYQIDTIKVFSNWAELQY